MQFVDNAPLYRLIRITGPRHNLLGLELASGPTEREPELEVLDPGAAQARLDGREVARQVMRGIEDACTELGCEYYVERIQYLAGDSLPTETYRSLASELIRRIDIARSRPKPVV